MQGQAELPRGSFAPFTAVPLPQGQKSREGKFSWLKMITGRIRHKPFSWHPHEQQEKRQWGPGMCGEHRQGSCVNVQLLLM